MNQMLNSKYILIDNNLRMCLDSDSSLLNMKHILHLHHIEYNSMMMGIRRIPYQSMSSKFFPLDSILQNKMDKERIRNCIVGKDCQNHILNSCMLLGNLHILYYLKNSRYNQQDSNQLIQLEILYNSKLDKKNMCFLYYILNN